MTTPIGPFGKGFGGAKAGRSASTRPSAPAASGRRASELAALLQSLDELAGPDDGASAAEPAANFAKEGDSDHSAE